jgi:beta-phosphoglucomutase-like phosphatase (HAD superfamily)
MTHAVIFDIDGTLLNSAVTDDQMYREAVLEIFGEVSFRAEMHEYDRVTDLGILLQIIEDNNLEPAAHSIEGVKNAFFARMRSFLDNVGSFDEVPGAKAVLRRISALEDHRLAIATGGWRTSAEMKLKSVGFELQDVSVLTSDDHVERTGIMKIALAELGKDFESVTYFGDALWDQRACHELDWNFRAVGPMLDGLKTYDGLYTG